MHPRTQSAASLCQWCKLFCAISIWLLLFDVENVVTRLQQHDIANMNVHHLVRFCLYPCSVKCYTSPPYTCNGNRILSEKRYVTEHVCQIQTYPHNTIFIARPIQFSNYSSDIHANAIFNCVFVSPTRKQLNCTFKHGPFRCNWYLAPIRTTLESNIMHYSVRTSRFNVNKSHTK